jgi:phospholipid-binding lipoprotein MlaA
MGLRISLISARLARFAAVLAVSSLLSACAGSPGPDGINDPYEAANRRVHGFNRGVDRVLVGPAAKGYGSIVPEPAQRVVGNVARTLDLPGDIANDLLQANVADAATNTLRLAVNLTMGVVGLFDAATAIGLPSQPTDFGETLAVWGVGEGAFIELPIAGPSTVRDTVGSIVDIVYDPMRYILPTAEANYATGIQVAAGLGRRYRYSKTIDSLLYESADSYAQTRLLYLQSRRFELGQRTEGEGDFVDPYEDPYGE